MPLDPFAGPLPPPPLDIDEIDPGHIVGEVLGDVEPDWSTWKPGDPADGKPADA